MAFIDYLAEKGVIKKSEIEEVLNSSGDAGGVDEIFEQKKIDQKEILKLRSEYFNVPARDISGIDVSFEVLKNVPEESALYYKFIPIGFEDGVLEIGIVDPGNISAKDAIEFIASKLGVPFKLYVISYEDFKSVAEQYKGISGEVNKALTELETEFVDKDVKEKSEEIEKKEIKDADSLSKIIEDAPVTKIVAVVLRHAIEGNASDIHIEHMGDRLRVRFRVDGTMHTSLYLPANVHSAVVSRVKILSNLRLDEKRKPQDGRFSARIENRKIDFRVSTLPAYYGEKIVMRILDSEKAVKDFKALGLSEENVKMVKEALKAPYGMILLTGPTGSGKTTTLYSMLNEIDRDSVNVISLEDPVEYNISGMSQSQIRPEIGYTFASGLRSVLRQDPDVIMVGEIRDKETAQLAIQAALTGHLVLSTLHTNNASGVIPRLVDMGVDPFLIAPTLILAIAQRLPKTLCKESKKIPVEESIKAMIENQVKDLPKERQEMFLSAKEIHEAATSSECQSGMRGRIGVFELLKIDKDIEHVILTNPVEEAVYKVAREKGMLTMKEDALLKSFEGVVPFEQANGL